MNTERIPTVPQWRYKSGYIVTPDGGLLYTGTNTINYISKISHEDETNNSVKILYSKHIVKRIDCDLTWDKKKYFACLSYDDTIFIWDLAEEKIIMGHKVHTKAVENDKIASETVCISFARNKKLLSIDSKTLISFCLLSNTYIKKNRIISFKHFVTALKCSPYKENIFAAGTSRGLVMLVDMETEQVLHTVAGHTIEITTLSWSINSPPPEVKSPEVSSDDIFDIYQVPDNEEFGVIRQKEVPSSDEDNFNVEKERPISRNENFNFVEACKDLKDQILANKASNDSSFEIKMEQNNGADKECDANLLENYASQSVGANTLSVSIESCSGSQSDNKSLASGSDVFRGDNTTYFLASGSRDFVVCVWKVTDLVESIAMPVNKLKTKKLLSAANSKGHYCMVSWLDSNILATNCRNGGCLTFTPLRSNENISFKRWKVFEEFTCLSPIPDSNLLWLIHPSKKIICHDVKNSKDLLEFTCISSNIATMKEVPVDMHTIAIACPDRRVAFLNTSSISRKCVKFDQFSRQIHSSVLSLSSCPTNGNNLAFGTDEGRVGIINLAQPKSNPTLLKPFSGKPVYSIDWLCEDYVLVCSDNKVGAYKYCEPSKDPKIIRNISSPSTISVRGNSLIVGKQNGNLALYIKDDDEIDFEQITEVSIGSKYISEISWNSINKQKFAACSFSNKLAVIKFVNHRKWEVIRTYNMNESISGAVCIRWSNKNEHLLLCSGLDGVIRLFDTSQESEDPIYLKQFIFPVSCTIFSPLDDNILICSGKGTTVEFLNIADNLGTKFCKQTYKKMRDKPPEVGWASQIMFESKASKQRSRKVEVEPTYKLLGDESDNSVVENLENIKISSEVADEELIKPSFEIPKKQATIFHLVAKEMNKNPLENTLKVLKMDSQKSVGEHVKNGMLTQKLFGDAKEVDEMLQNELRNYHTSNAKTIGQIIIPQIQGALKEDIIEKIKAKKLTEHHVSLAPTISYEFWKQCCVAYANQLMEVRLPLQALPYLLALHDIKQSIETLIKSNYYREAWVVAKIHLQDDDPTLDNILQKWIEYMDMNGNLDGAVLLCTISQKYNLAQTILEKRRERNENVVEILELLREKCEK